METKPWKGEIIGRNFEEQILSLIVSLSTQSAIQQNLCVPLWIPRCPLCFKKEII